MVACSTDPQLSAFWDWLFFFAGWWVETVVNGVTKSSGQGSTGVLAPIREWSPGGWRGKRGKRQR